MSQIPRCRRQFLIVCWLSAIATLTADESGAHQPLRLGQITPDEVATATVRLVGELGIAPDRPDLPADPLLRLRYLATLAMAQEWLADLKERGRELRMFTESQSGSRIYDLRREAGNPRLPADQRQRAATELASAQAELAALDGRYVLPEGFLETWAAQARPDAVVQECLRQVPAEERRLILALLGHERWNWAFWTGTDWQPTGDPTPAWLEPDRCPVMDIARNRIPAALRAEIRAYLDQLTPAREAECFAAELSHPRARKDLQRDCLPFDPIPEITIKGKLIGGLIPDELYQEIPPTPAEAAEERKDQDRSARDRPAAPPPPGDGASPIPEFIGLPDELRRLVEPCQVYLGTMHRPEARLDIYRRVVPELKAWCDANPRSPLVLAALNTLVDLVGNLSRNESSPEARDRWEALRREANRRIQDNPWGYAPFRCEMDLGDPVQTFFLLDYCRRHPTPESVVFNPGPRSLSDFFEITAKGFPTTHTVPTNDSERLILQNKILNEKSWREKDLGSLDAYVVEYRPVEMLSSLGQDQERQIYWRFRNSEIFSVSQGMIYNHRNRPAILERVLRDYADYPDLWRAARLELERHRLGVIAGDPAHRHQEHLAELERKGLEP